MNPSLRTLFLAGAVALLAGGCAQDHPMQGRAGGSMPVRPGMGHAAPGSGSHQMHEHMMGGMHQMQRMPLSGDTDVDFVRMMREHHVQGIGMARIELRDGDDPEAREMARKIIEQQSREVAEFDRWLQRHR